MTFHVGAGAPTPEQHPAGNMQVFLDFALEVAIRLTSSRIGYIYLYDEESRQPTSSAWSRGVMRVWDPQTVYDPDMTGLWGGAVRQRKPIVANSCGGHDPLKRGCAEGHASLSRFLTLPAFSAEKIVAVIGVANKTAPYDEADVRQLTLLLDSVWQTVDLRRARHALREKERLFRSVFETASDAMIIVAFDGSVADANRPACAALGYSREEIRGKQMREICREAQVADPLRWPGARFPSQGFHYCRWHRRGGAEVPVEAAAVPVGYDGSPALLVVAREVSDRLEAGSRIRFQARLLEEVGQAVAATDLSGRIIYWNKAATALYGWSVEEALGKEVAELIALKNDRQAARERIRSMMTRDFTAATRETTVKDKNGRSFLVHITNTPLLDESGAQVGLVGISFDLTERKNAEEALRLAEERFQQSEKMVAVGRLAGGVAHDFNNLLTVIKGYCDIAVERSQADEFLREDLGEIRHAADRASSLTSQLLAFSRRQVLQPRAICLVGLVEGMRDMLQRLVGEDIELVVHAEANPWRVLADSGRIEQAVMNLVVNARDAMPEGGVLSIETSNTRVDGGPSHPGVPEGEYVMLAVRDAGCGMERAILDHLFEPFFTTKDKGKGTGLGLATVYGIVKQSNGFITCQSETDRGTIFKIYLPRCCEQYGEENTRRPEGEGPEPLHGTETILLVEDDQCVRELINSILVKAGYAVLPARTGAEALAAVADTLRRVDLLITDVIMPGMDGRRVAEEVMKRRPSARVLYVSGYTESSVVQRRVLCGRQNFMQKPFAAADLLRKVRETLDSGA